MSWIDTPCVIHTGYVDRNGYGKTRGKWAHRVAWEECNGPIPKGAHVCHRCDVRLCVNTEHMFLGLPADNEQDKIQKGRNPSRERWSEIARRREAAMGKEGRRARALKRESSRTPERQAEVDKIRGERLNAAKMKKTAEERTAIAKRAWETRRRKKELAG